MIIVDPEKCLRCSKCIKDCIVEVLKAGPDGIPFLAPELEKYCLNSQH
jgi:ferredoxin